MADSKKSRGKADRAKVSASEPYEVKYFAKKNKITTAMTKKLIRNDRTLLLAIEAVIY